MKTFEISDEMEKQLTTAAKDLQLENVTVAVDLALKTLLVLAQIERESGSLYVKNKQGESLPLTLTPKSQKALELRLAQELKNKANKNKKSKLLK